MPVEEHEYRFREEVIFCPIVRQAKKEQTVREDRLAPFSAVRYRLIREEMKTAGEPVSFLVNRARQGRDGIFSCRQVSAPVHRGYNRSDA